MHNHACQATHTHTLDIHTCLPTYKHIYIHKYIHTYIISTDSWMCMCTHTCMHINRYACIPFYI